MIRKDKGKMTRTTTPMTYLLFHSLESVPLTPLSSAARYQKYQQKKRDRHCAFGTKSHAAYMDAQQHRVFIWKRIAEVEGMPSALGSKYGLRLALR